jgi:cyclohexadienyl dehydratase
MLLGVSACRTPALSAPPAPAPQVAAAPPLRAAASADYAPFSVRDARGFSGFAVTLLERFATRQGRSVTWLEFRWPTLVAELGAGAFELAASGISVRPERSIAGRYSLPIARTGSVLLLRRPSWFTLPTDDLEAALKALDRAELRIGVNQGGHLERTARKTFANAQIVTFPDNRLVPEALARGALDAALTNTIEAERWAAQSGKVERIGPFTREDVAFFLRADDAALADALDAFLITSEADGTLGQLRREQLGDAASEPTALPLQALLAASAERLALMPFVAAAKERAQLAIEDPAQETKVLAAAQNDVRAAAETLHHAAPAEDRVRAFVRAQIEAAKAVQSLPRVSAEGSEYTLDRELRPAIARISQRMSLLLVRLAEQAAPADLEALTWSYLRESGLDRAHSDAIAHALAALAAH